MCLEFSNVRFEGSMVGEDLFGLVLNAKVCIAPYRQTRNINDIVEMPNKFWLYLACGKPIISCIIPNIHLNEPFVYQCEDEKDFVTKVIRAITDNTEMIESQRSEFARSNTWEVRIDTLEKIYASKN
jgi:glycosyltransferase involved in cell wall biosynthesis